MKYKLLIGLGVCFTCLLLVSFQSYKKKKFLDNFTEYKLDTITFNPPSYSRIVEDRVGSPSEIGNSIDGSFSAVFSNDEAEDLRYVNNIGSDVGPFGYIKMKLNSASGYYFVVIRAGGEYWNSRVYGCLYNAGEDRITETVLIAEQMRDAGATFICNSTIKKENKEWSIYTHEYFQEPWNYDSHVMDSLSVTDEQIKYSVQLSDDHYHFKQEILKKETYLKNKHQ